MIQLNGLDGLFIAMEMRGLPMHISSFSVYDPASGKSAGTKRKKISFAQIKATFHNVVTKHVPVLRSVLKEVPFRVDQPYWVDEPNFNIDLHVRRIALPQPADWSTLRETLANLHAEPLSRDKPLWEAVVIERLDGIEWYPRGSFGIFLKVHHALMDGRTGLRIFTNLHSLQPDQPPIAASHSGAPRCIPNSFDQPEQFTDPSLRTMLERSTRNNIQRTRGLLNLLGNTLPRVLLDVRNGLLQEELKHISNKESSCFNNIISQRRVIDRLRIPLGTVHGIRSKVAGCTSNEVALTVISGAMRRYSEAMGSLPEGSMVATVPIDVRNRHDRNKTGNILSIMNIALATDVEDPLQRLLCVHKESNYSKRYASTLGKHLLIDLLDAFFPALLAWGMKPFVNSSLFHRMPIISNTIITNVPGVRVPLYFAGARMVDSFGLGPLVPNTSLFHTVSSHCDWLTISFVSCPEAMSDPNLYKQCLKDAFHELCVATDVSSVVALSDRMEVQGLAQRKRRAEVAESSFAESSVMAPSEVESSIAAESVVNS